MFANLSQKFIPKSPIFILILALIIGFVTRFVFLTSYTQFDGEQARSGVLLMKMWHGEIPTLGAPSSIGGFGILPYYYYWTFLWTIFGASPIWQAMSNTFPSFWTILLIFIVIYKLLHSDFVSFGQIWQDLQTSFPNFKKAVSNTNSNTNFTTNSEEKSKRKSTAKLKTNANSSIFSNLNFKLLIASFGSLFYSIFFTEIWYSQMEWNPNSGTFWTILLILTLENLWNLELNFGKNNLKNTQENLEKTENVANLKNLENKSEDKNKQEKTDFEQKTLTNNSQNNLRLIANPTLTKTETLENQKEKLQNQNSENSGKTENLDAKYNPKLSSLTSKEKSKLVYLLILFGFLVNMNLSLHSSFLFTLPTFLVIFTFLWIFHRKNKLILLGGFGTSFVFGLPYLIGEIGRGFGNTFNLLSTLSKSQASSSNLGNSIFNSLGGKLDKLIFSTLEIGKLAYFEGSNFYLFGQVFLVVLLVLTILFYENLKSNLLNLLTGFWLIFVIIASNFGGTLHAHYLVILWSFPCLLTAILIYFFSNIRIQFPNFSKVSTNFILIFLIFGSILSFGLNISKVYQYFTAKFGEKRLTNTKDTIQVLNSLPKESLICTTDPTRQNSLDYLSRFVVKKNQRIIFCGEAIFGNFGSNIVKKTAENVVYEFVFWENYSSSFDFEMKLETKPKILESWQIVQKIGNIQILQKSE